MKYVNGFHQMRQLRYRAAIVGTLLLSFLGGIVLFVIVFGGFFK